MSAAVRDVCLRCYAAGMDCYTISRVVNLPVMDVQEVCK